MRQAESNHLNSLKNEFSADKPPGEVNGMNTNMSDVFPIDRNFFVSTCIPPQFRYQEFLIIPPSFQTVLGSS